MTLFSGLHRPLAGIALTLVSAGAANAGSIFTPFIFQGAGDQIICIASNVSTSAITVGVTIIGSGGNATQVCTLPAGDKNGCRAFRVNDSGRCRITVNGLTDAQVFARVRGVLMERRITSPFTIGAVVEAR